MDPGLHWIGVETGSWRCTGFGGKMESWSLQLALHCRHFWALLHRRPKWGQCCRGPARSFRQRLLHLAAGLCTATVTFGPVARCRHAGLYLLARITARYRAQLARNSVWFAPLANHNVWNTARIACLGVGSCCAPPGPPPIVARHPTWPKGVTHTPQVPTKP